MEISHRIKDLRMKFSLSQEAFAEKIGLSRGNYSQIELGKQLPTIKTLIDIARIFNISYQWLLDGEGRDQIIKEPISFYGKRKDGLADQDIPLYNIEASAGLIHVFNERSENIIDYIHIPKLPKCDGAIQITGDSMYPLLKSGDIVIYKILNDKSTLIPGEMYLLSFDLDGDFYTAVKYLHKSEKREEWIKLVSYNKNHQDMDVLIDKIRALGFVKASIRINSMA